MMSDGTVAILTTELGRYNRFWISLIAEMHTWEEVGAITLNFQVAGVNLAETRNRILRQAVGDWVWMLDDDHQWEAGMLKRLLDRQVDVVSPLNVTRTAPFSPCYLGAQVGDSDLHWVEVLPPGRRGLREVATAGGAGMLIQRRVWEAMEPPWFTMGHPNPEVMGEDHAFCKKAREAGFRVWVDLDLPMGHITPAVLTPRQDASGVWQTVIEVGGQIVIIPAAKGRSMVEIVEQTPKLAQLVKEGKVTL